MIKSNYSLYLLLTFISIIILSCGQKKSEKNTIRETRTSGTVIIAVDATLDKFLTSQIQVFQSDYPDALVKTISDNENKLIPDFANGKIKLMVLTRMLKPEETVNYTRKKSPIDIDRVAIDGIALITNTNYKDSTITANEVYNLMKGKSNLGMSLLFDNAYSSTIRYFIDSAKIQKLPSTGVHTLNNTDDVIKYVTKNNSYIGVIGLNWLLDKQLSNPELTKTIKILAVKNIKGKNGDDNFYRPTQQNLMNGKYPFLRNIYVINGEGTNGLGTGFANWLSSPRGQLIVLKSGLAPHELAEREFNLRTDKKKK